MVSSTLLLLMKNTRNQETICYVGRNARFKTSVRHKPKWFNSVEISFAEHEKRFRAPPNEPQCVYDGFQCFQSNFLQAAANYILRRKIPAANHQTRRSDVMQCAGLVTHACIVFACWRALACFSVFVVHCRSQLRICCRPMQTGPSSGHLGAILGPSSGHLGALLGPLGAILGPS